MAHFADRHVGKENGVSPSPKTSLSDQDPEPGLMAPDNLNLVRLCETMDLIEQIC
jgi:hypothetical protein